MGPALSHLVELTASALVAYGVTVFIVYALRRKGGDFSILQASAVGVTVAGIIIIFVTASGAWGVALLVVWGEEAILFVLFGISLLAFAISKTWVRWVFFLCILGAVVWLVDPFVSSLASLARLEVGLYKVEPWLTYADTTGHFEVNYPSELSVDDFIATGTPSVAKFNAGDPETFGTISITTNDQPNYFYQGMPVYEGTDSCTRLGGFTEQRTCAMFQPPETITVDGVSTTVYFEGSGSLTNINAILQGTDRSISFNAELLGNGYDPIVQDIFLKMLASMRFTSPFTPQPTVAAGAPTVYADPRFGYAITYPSTWSYVVTNGSSGDQGVTFSGCGPGFGNSCNGTEPAVQIYAVPVMVGVPPAEFPGGLPQYVDWRIAPESKAFSSVVTSTATVASAPAIRVIENGTSTDGSAIQAVDLWFEGPGMLYEISYWYNVGDAKTESAEEAVVATFKVL